MKKLEEELKKLKSFRMAYELSLCDMNLARLLEKFYMIHMKLMKDWGEYDDKNARFGGKGTLPKLWSYLP